MPFDPSWIEHAEAFHHPDPRMLKSALKLLFTAWRGTPAASIPSSHSFISETTGLPPELVAERYIVLTDGFVLREDGRLHHEKLSGICQKMIDGYGPEIESFSVALAMVSQDPEQFSLKSVEAGKANSKLRGKHLIPKNFGFDSHPELRSWCLENGYPAPNQQRFILEKFVDFAVMGAHKYADWAATFRNYARNEFAYNKLPPVAEWPAGHPALLQPAQPPTMVAAAAPKTAFANLARGRTTMPAQTRGEAALEHNRGMMSARRPAQRERG